MVGSNKKHGNTRNNRRHQRGGMLSNANIADQLIYPYMHDVPFPPYKALEQYNTPEFKAFVAANINDIRLFMGTPALNLSMFTVKGQTFIEFGKFLRNSFNTRFDNQHSALMSGQLIDDELPLGWVTTPDNQYVNIFTNTKQAAKPVKQAEDALWSVQRQASLVPAMKRPILTAVRPTLTSVRPTLTADKTNITTEETVTITPTYGKSATLMVTRCEPPMIANSDANNEALDTINGLIKETHGSAPFVYNNLPPGTYVLRLIGDDSSDSDPLTITVEEPKSSGRGGKTRGHKRRPCKRRTRNH